MTPIENAVQAKTAAQAHLDSILASGDDPSAARAALESAEAQILEIEQAAAAAEAAEAAEVEAQADIMVEAVRSETGEILARIFAGIKQTAPIDVDRGNALVLVAAQRRHGDARDALADSQARVDALTERLADLQSERQSLVGRRGRGDVRDGDKADLLLIACDSEGIEQALNRATPERDRLATAARESRASLSQAENLVAGDREQAIQKSLREAQAPIEDALVLVAQEFKRNSTTNHAPWWVLNVELKNLTRPR